MKTLAAITLTLTTATFGFAAESVSATDLTFDSPVFDPLALTFKAEPVQLLATKQGLTYSELFDLEERFVDEVVYSMMDADPSLIEQLFDINAVRVSSDGQFATVVWRYDRSISGVTLLKQQGDYISILAERSETLPQYSLEVIGVPPAAAAEIAIH